MMRKWWIIDTAIIIVLIKLGECAERIGKHVMIQSISICHPVFHTSLTLPIDRVGHYNIFLADCLCVCGISISVCVWHQSEKCISEQKAKAEKKKTNRCVTQEILMRLLLPWWPWCYADVSAQIFSDIRIKYPSFKQSILSLSLYSASVDISLQML